MALRNAFAELALDATLLNRYGGGKSAAVGTATGVGDTTIITPASGKKIKLYWVSAINDPDEAASPLIKVILGTTELYRAYAIAHWEIFTGPTDGVLKVNLDQAGSVAVTAHYEEVT